MFFHQCFVCLLLGSISRDIFICSLGLSITFRALQRKKNTRLKFSPVSSEHPTCLWFWSSLGIRLFLIQRTSRLKWVSKVLWRTSLVPWLLPSSSLYSLCDQNWWEGAWERGYEKCHFPGPQQKCKGSLYNAYIFMLLMSACLNTMETMMLRNHP